MKIANKTTQKAIKEVRAGKNVKEITLDEVKRIKNEKLIFIRIGTHSQLFK